MIVSENAVSHIDFLDKPKRVATIFQKNASDFDLRK